MDEFQVPKRGFAGTWGGVCRTRPVLGFTVVPSNCEVRGGEDSYSFYPGCVLLLHVYNNRTWLLLFRKRFHFCSGTWSVLTVRLLGRRDRPREKGSRQGHSGTLLGKMK